LECLLSFSLFIFMSPDTSDDFCPSTLLDDCSDITIDVFSF
jgi:hypothetical protein